MATEAKFSTVLPNNSIKGAVNATPISQVYQEKTNTLGPLENEFHGNDVQFSLNTAGPGVVATVLLPPSYKLLNDVYLEIQVNTNGTPGTWTTDMIAYKCLNQFIYRIPGCERMYFDGQNIPFLILNAAESPFKQIRHIELSGTKELGASASKTYYLIAKLPLPCCSLFGDPEKKPKPIPLHMFGEPMELMFKFQSTLTAMGFGTNTTAQIGGANLYFNYGHLGAFAEYKNVIYKQLFDAVYDFEYAVPNASRGIARSVVLTGVRSGETTMLRVRCIERIPASATDNIYAFYGLPLTDLKLRYAGQLIWQSDYDLHGSYHMDYSDKPNFWARRVENYSIAAVDVSGTGTSTLTTLTGTANNPTNPIAVTGISGATGTVAIGALSGNVVTTLTSGAGTSTNTQSINVDKIGVRSYYYDIPIGTILTYMKKNGYVLGADFNNSELKLDFIIAGTQNGIANGAIGPQTPTADPDAANFVAFNNADVHVLAVSQFVTSMYQYNGERAVLIQ